MEFEINYKQKRKARKIRQRVEKQWRIYKILSKLFLVISMTCLIVGLFFVNNEQFLLNDLMATFFSLMLIAYIIVRTVLNNLSSHWLMDRLNERIWIADGYMYHFVQTAFAAGLNSRRSDERAYLFIMDLKTITSAMYDPQSKRIEFRVRGEGMHYTDWYKKIVDKKWPLNGYQAIFYDCTQPSLYEYLKSEGIVFENTTIDFNVRDKRL